MSSSFLPVVFFSEAWIL